MVFLILSIALLKQIKMRNISNNIFLCYFYAQKFPLTMYFVYSYQIYLTTVNNKLKITSKLKAKFIDIYVQSRFFIQISNFIYFN